MISQRKRWLPAVLLLSILAAAAFGIWYSDVWRLLLDRQAIEKVLERLGPWGPVAAILLESIQVVVAPIPGQVTALAIGYIFGAFWGTLYALMGLLIGTTVATWLARRYGRPLVERLVSDEKLEYVDDLMKRRGATAVLVAYLVPFTPDDVVCYAAGLTPLRIGEIVILALIGRTPSMITVTWFGAHATELSWQTLVIIAVGSIALAVLFARHQERIEDVIFCLLDAINPRR